MEERKRRHHHPAVEKARRVVRLDARTLHDGPGIFALRATRFRGPLQKGLIYRGKRMVNWCPASLTALSDEEVVMKEQKGFLYYFKVEVAEIPGTFLTIATTRPETIPGDTAVAVNPKDPRYANLIGKHILRPLPAEFSREQK